MSTLGEKLAKTPLQGSIEYQEYNPYNSEAIDETWKYVLGARLGLSKTPYLGLYNKGLGLYNQGLDLYNEYKPFINDVREGRDLLFSNILKNNREIRELGKNYLNNYLSKNPIDTQFGTIEFRNKLINETDPDLLWQLPFARFNLYRAQKNIKMPNKKLEVRKDADVFDNIEVNMFGKKYDYQVRNNKNDKSKDLYNMKHYKFLERDIEKLKENPKLYQKFIELNKGL